MTHVLCLKQTKVTFLSKGKRVKIPAPGRGYLSGDITASGLQGEQDMGRTKESNMPASTGAKNPRAQ